MSGRSPTLTELGERLVSFAYRELSQTNVAFSYGRISSFANVRWGENSIQVTCSFKSRNWAEPALIGLISHE
ncbi:MAG: hypothetical protein ACFE8Z_11445, partial [Candidatus Hermodarchaeota archaeon]